MNVQSLIIAGALAGGGLFLLYMSRRLIWLGLSSYWWRKTDGTVIESHAVLFSVPGTAGGRGPIGPMQYCEAEHTYVYVVKGQTYRSSTYCYGGWMERARTHYSRGEKVTVYYHSRHPEVSVLKRGLRFTPVFGLVPLAMGIALVIRHFR